MSSNITITRACEWCGNEFTAKTTVTRYCSHKCSSAGYKARKRDAKIAVSNTEVKKTISKPIKEIKAKEFLTVKDAATLLGFSIRTTYRLIESGALRATNLGERITRIKRSDLELLLTPPPVVPQKPPKQYDISECYTVGEAQEQFGISGKALYEIINRNDIPKFQKGKFVYIPKELIDKVFN